MVKENPPVSGYLGRGAGLEGACRLSPAFYSTFNPDTLLLFHLILYYFLYTLSLSYAILYTGPPPVVIILELTKSRSVDVQLAACLWCVIFFFYSLGDYSHRFASPSLTHLIRAGGFTLPSGSIPTSSSFPSVHAPVAHPSTSSPAPFSSPHPSLYGSSSSSSLHSSRAPTSTAPANGQGLSFVNTHSSQSNTYQSYASLEEACTRTVINVFCRLMALPLTGSGTAAMGNTNVSLAEGIDSDAALVKTKACFTLRESHFFLQILL